MFYHTKNRLIHLKSKGYTPNTCLDLGSNIGDWNLMFTSIFPNCDILSIDANPICAFELKNRNLNHRIALIGDKEMESVNFYVDDDFLSGGASIYLENTIFYKNPNIIKLPMATLDSLDMNFDFIKMDIQGAELDAIKGGLKTITNCSFLLLELAVVNYNMGSPLSNEIINYLNNLNFVIYDIFDLHYDTFYKKNNQLLQIDMCFINKNKLGNYLNEW